VSARHFDGRDHPRIRSTTTAVGDTSRAAWVQGRFNDKGAHGAPVVLRAQAVKIEQGPPNQVARKRGGTPRIQEGVIDATIGNQNCRNRSAQIRNLAAFPDFVV